MKASEHLGELATALAKAQGEFTTIPKTAENPFFKSTYAALPDVVEIASPILASHGLAVSQLIGADENGDTLTTVLMHTSGQYMASTMRLKPVKNDPQSQGSATTYARRYSYMSILGLVADEDDDAQKAQKGAQSNSGGRQGSSGESRRGGQRDTAVVRKAPAPASTDAEAKGGIQGLIDSELTKPQATAFKKWLWQAHKCNVDDEGALALLPEIEVVIAKLAAGEAP